MSPARRPGPSGRYEQWPRQRPRRRGPGPKRAGGRKPFGATWWGREWVEALQERASLDPNRLPRGRTYARQGAVGALDVGPGEVTAPVQGSRRTPYQARVRVRVFSEQEWGTVLDALATQAGHAAALLEGELLPEVVGDVRAVGLDLLPGTGEVQPRCSCPDWADPCKHAAAVCYLVADELDRDPFQLFLLRGKSREELLAGVRAWRRQSDSAASERLDPVTSSAEWEGDSGMVAREVWHRDAVLDAPAPHLPAPPRRPGKPTLLLDAAPNGSGLDARTLMALAADAARRAWSLATGGDGGTDLSFEQDCARWATAIVEGALSPVDVDELACRAGLDRRTLLLHALAWQTGGRGGLDALLDVWDPGPSELASGRDQLGAASRVSHNRVTSGDRQLRLGREGAWFPYRKVRGSWQPEKGPTAFPEGPED